MGELYQLQKSFTEHLRDPDNVPVPAGLDKRRVGIYSDLIFNNVSALLVDFFPVIHSILTSAQWDEMVRSYFITHQSETPYFMEISGEFAAYLNQHQLSGDLPDFLPELAHYEWVELALFTMDEDKPAGPIDTDLIGDSPLFLSPLAQPLAYTYPVHQIRIDFQPTEPSATPCYLLVLRDNHEKVRFFELQPLSYQLLHDIQAKPGLIARDWLNDVATQINSEDKSGFISNGIKLLQSFNEHNIFLNQ